MKIITHSHKEAELLQTMNGSFLMNRTANPNKSINNCTCILWSNRVINTFRCAKRFNSYYFPHLKQSQRYLRGIFPNRPPLGIHFSCCQSLNPRLFSFSYKRLHPIDGWIDFLFGSGNLHFPFISSAFIEEKRACNFSLIKLCNRQRWIETHPPLTLRVFKWFLYSTGINNCLLLCLQFIYATILISWIEFFIMTMHDDFQI